MAVKQIVLSDLSSDELTDENHTRVQVKHPDIAFPVELDISSEEAGQLVNTTLRLIEFTIFEPNKPPRTALVETKTVDSLFKDVDFDKVLEGARKIAPTAAPVKRAAKAAPKSSDRVDYTDPSHYGQLHRGRITDEEARLVRENMEQASTNRQAQGHPPIDWTDSKEKSRYGL